MDILFINDLRVTTLIGINPDERLHPQQININLEIQYDASQAAQQDDIHAAINYAQVSAAVENAITNVQFNLIESLAEHVTTLILKQFNIQSVKLTVIKKPADMPNVNHVGITIERNAASS